MYRIPPMSEHPDESDEDYDGPQDDAWIASAYERQHPRPERDTLTGMAGR